MVRVRMSFAAVLALVSVVQAGPSVVYTNLNALSNSAIPGAPGEIFNSFDRPLASRTGSHWIFLARSQNPNSALDGHIVAGSGTIGTAVVREGVTAIIGTRVPDSLSDRRISINDTGAFAAAMSIDGSTADDQVVVKGQLGSSSFALIAAEGAAVPALPGITYGSTLAEAMIDNDATVQFRASLSGASATNAAIVGNSGNSIVAQKGVTVPTGQIPAPQSYNSFAFNGHIRSGSGLAWATRGTLNGPTAVNSVLVKNNAVIAQVGGPVSNIPFTNFATLISSPNIGGDDVVWSKGVAGGLGYVAADNAVVARTGDSVPGGLPGEVYSNGTWTPSSTAGNTFLHAISNASGDTIIASFTSAGTGQDVVWVYNNSTVILRRGDQIDLDGDGSLDDAYIDTNDSNASASIGSWVDSGFLTENQEFVFTSGIRLGTGPNATFGQALVRVVIPEPATLASLAAVGAGLLRRR